MRAGMPLVLVGACLLLFLSGCASPKVKQMEVTSYCGCGKCCEWERGSWKYLKLNFWNKYVSSGPREGEPYSERTASGTYPDDPQPGLFSVDSLKHPWMIPVRILLPWRIPPQDGTIAADTRYYPFGTRMYVPGYGYGVVEDRGSAIKGPRRLDVFYHDHQEALDWGRRELEVRILE
ncbi:MAG: 3D domain-containing protein [Desulfohalobiaceae bacterium]|nr:3D domain-containing protein [Desulfohalobiaceae bacterium]